MTITLERQEACHFCGGTMTMKVENVVDWQSGIWCCAAVHEKLADFYDKFEEVDNDAS